jgi:hypothetical protein
LLERLNCTVSSIFSKAFAFSDLLDFLLGQVESDMCRNVKRMKRGRRNVGRMLKSITDRHEQRFY